MKKRITTLLLTLVLSIAFLPAYAFAEGETGADSNWYQAEYHGKPLAVSVDEDGENVSITPGSGDYIIIHKGGTDIRCEFKVEYNQYSGRSYYVLYNTDENDNNYIDSFSGWSGWYISPTEADIEIYGYSYDDNNKTVRWGAVAKLTDLEIYNEVSKIEFVPSSTTLYSEDIKYTDEDGKTAYDLWMRSIHSQGGETWPSRFIVGEKLIVYYENGRTRTYVNTDYYDEDSKEWQDGFFCGEEMIYVSMWPVEDDLKVGSNLIEVEYHARKTTFTINVETNKPGGEVAPAPVPTTQAIQNLEIQDLKAVKISKPAAAKKKVTVKWKKVAKKDLKKIQGIEIQVAADPSFTNIVKTATVGKKKASKKIGGLQSKTTYWIRIRAYKDAADGRHVSVWKTKKVKIK